MSLRKWILLSVLFSMLVGCSNSYSSGDRVLVTKGAYDSGVNGPQRYDVVVFKYPVKPVNNGVPTNYIKRLLGLPGELLAVFFGRVYHSTPAQAPFDDSAANPNDRWQSAFMHKNDPASHASFEAGEFEILRKPPQVMLAMRRIVFDNDYQARDLKGTLDRWNPNPTSGWKSDKETGFTHEGKGEQIDWLHYQHLLRPEKAVGGDGKEKPKLITDSMAYNNFNDQTPPHANWVGDLMIECNVQVIEPKGEFFFQLNKGIYRYQAHWDVATGKCTLKSIDKNGKEKELATETTNFKSPGNYMLRFANVDARLTVWVDRALPFGDGKEYSPPEVRGKDEKDLSNEMLEARRGPFFDAKDQIGDLKPASLGSKGANVKITHLRLWRDTYYTTTTEHNEWDYQPNHMDPESWADPTKWDPLRKLRALTMYVQPGHYLCMGDNSQASSDSRSWGTVPDRLMLGRALVVYFPLDRIGAIR